jgi:hypothetical protein
MVNSWEQTFELSESKVTKLKDILKQAIAEYSTSPRRLAAVAGKLIAASPAVLPAALYSRSLFEALQGRVGWDEVFPTPETVVKTAEFWLENIDGFNGRRWWPRATSATVTVDASGVRYGGWIEISGQEPLPFSGTFTEQQASSSITEREIIGYVAGLAVAAQAYPQALAESSVLILGDNQGGISALNHMRSSVPLISSALKEALELSAAFEFDITARWVPREENQAADALSREPDASDWGIDPRLLSKIVNHFQIRIAVDLFASSAHHVCVDYVSQYYTPGCLAVHAFKQDWAGIQERVGDGVAWVSPPSKSASLALSLIGKFKTNALVCISAKEGSLEKIQLQKLEENGAAVSSGYGIPKAASCCKPSLRVPPNVTNPAFLGLSVYLKAWI